jgi:hypothetical protein
MYRQKYVYGCILICTFILIYVYAYMPLHILIPSNTLIIMIFFLPGKGTPVLLSPGDILYMPRGTIHEAVAQNEFSTHVTISVYQHYNKKKLLSLLIPKLLESAFQKNIEFRKGLPLRMNEKLGSFVSVEENYLNIAKLGEEAQSENSNFEHSSWRKNLVLEVKSLVTFLSSEVWSDVVFVCIHLQYF